MKTFKCPICGGSFELFEEGANIYLYQCMDCSLASSVGYTEKEALEEAEKLISQFPPIMKVEVGDRIIVDKESKKIQGVDVNKGIIWTGVLEYIIPSEVDKWPWDLENRKLHDENVYALTR